MIIQANHPVLLNGNKLINTETEENWKIIVDNLKLEDHNFKNPLIRSKKYCIKEKI